MRLHKVVSDDGLEACPYCFSEERAARERGIVERFAKRSGQALTELSEGLAGPRARKRIERIRDRIGRPEARSRRLARHYDITVDTDPTGRHAAAVRFSRRRLQGSMVTHPGVCCLHMTLTGIGAVFRSLKSEPGLRPIHRHKPIRTGGRLSVTVVAHQPVQVIRTRLRAAATAKGGSPSAGPRKGGSASPPPSGAATDASCMCARRHVPKRPDSHRASIRGGRDDVNHLGATAPAVAVAAEADQRAGTSFAADAAHVGEHRLAFLRMTPGEPAPDAPPAREQPVHRCVRRVPVGTAHVGFRDQRHGLP